ncbi:hypothetical protein BGZ88_001505 [Linnemannia elongata]|nr:hypothetical protein BGZ88_001505 [Linnemannia elongata]
MVASGTSMTLGWSLTTMDSYMYDSLSALVYCMDYSGPDYNIWREIGTLFSNTAIWPTARFTFKLPECGPRVGATAVRMVAQGWGGVFYGEDACVFSVNPLTTDVQPPTTTTPNSNKMPPPTTTPENSFIQPPTTVPPPPTSNPPLPIAPTNRPTEGVTTSPVVLPPSTATTGPSLKVSPSSGTSTNGAGDTGSTFSPAVQTSYPPWPSLPTFPNGGGVSPPIGPTAEKNDNSAALKATLLSVGVFAGLAAVVVPLLVMRRRRMRRNRKLASRSEELITGGAAPGMGGTGAVMKEKKRRLGHKPKEGYFYKMEDEDDGEIDNDDMQQSSGDLEKQHAASTMTASATAAVTASADGATETRDRSMAVGAGVGQLDAVTVPQMALLGDTTTAAASFHKRRSSLPYMVTSHYTMSSFGDGSSIDGDDSSVVRKYWAASMAARAERRLEGHSPTRGLEDDSDAYGYDEGSIFGDQSRDSDSRMADILSLRTTGSVDGTAGGTMDTARHHLYEQYQQREPYRRDTLNTSFGDGISTRTMTPSLSSVQDSCPFSEEEFLERMHFEQLQAQLQHEYYAQQQREHHQRYHHHHGDTESMMSRRTSSVPSLTSTNDPFKTFDSNEIVLDQDQDQEQHHHRSEDPFADSRRCTPSPEPSLRVPTMDRSNSDLVGFFPTVPHSP